jgi:hypothetical protein
LGTHPTQRRLAIHHQSRGLKKPDLADNTSKQEADLADNTSKQEAGVTTRETTQQISLKDTPIAKIRREPTDLATSWALR